ncbi:hypothetical protein [Halomarina rubra]|uniref:Uncharacterized protein n=1 Tax=Halomarina rubra TaxID=2071873 RepID=A0ABD6AT42_9EURY|nr:hypothetical protein [Halomarina rubra]
MADSFFAFSGRRSFGLTVLVRPVHPSEVSDETREHHGFNVGDEHDHDTKEEGASCGEGSDVTDSRADREGEKRRNPERCEQPVQRTGEDTGFEGHPQSEEGTEDVSDTSIEEERKDT